MEKIKVFFEKWWLNILKNHYIDFEGKANRETFWMFVLCNIIISIIISILGSIIGTSTAMVISSIFSLAVLIPTIALMVRRLNDIDKSPLWLLIIFVPFIGWIWLIVLLATDSKTNTNE
jgi:uncharacterized membrane protein YhaH (DUF805 family)